MFSVTISDTGTEINQKEINQKEMYKKISFLGDGARGKVYEVEKDGKSYALKDISKVRLDDSEILTMKFNLEIQKNLDHPNINKVFEIFEDTFSIVAIMELCQDDLYKKRKTLDRKEIPNIFRQIVEAVLYLEDKNLIHNDIKLANVVMCNGIPKLTDFDRVESYICDKEGKTNMTGYEGYEYYMAPEMCRNGYTIKINSWQLGMLLYGLLADKYRPVNIEKNFYQKYTRHMDGYEYVSKNAPSIPENLKENPLAYDLLSKLLQPDPNLRPPVREILEHPYLK